MNSMLLGLFPLLVVLTWSAGYVLVERAWRQHAPGRHIAAALLCAGFSLAAIAALAWAMPQPGQNWSDAPCGASFRTTSLPWMSRQRVAGSTTMSAPMPSLRRSRGEAPEGRPRHA